MNSLSQRTLVIDFYSKNPTRRSGLHTMSTDIFFPSSDCTSAVYRMANWLESHTSMWQIPAFGSGQWWTCKQYPTDSVLSSHWTDGIRYQCFSCRGEIQPNPNCILSEIILFLWNVEIGPALIWHEDICSSYHDATNLACNVSFITLPPPICSCGFWNPTSKGNISEQFVLLTVT